MGAADRPGPPATPGIALYQPTFLYESLWDLGVAALLIWAGRRFVLRRGQLFALYVAAYTVGRGWVEALRVDHANHFLGLRLNDWTSLVVFLGALAFLLVSRGSGSEANPPEPELLLPGHVAAGFGDVGPDDHDRSDGEVLPSALNGRRGEESPPPG